MSSPFTFASYLTVDQAEFYFAARVETSAWANSTLQQKNAALIDATRRIDRLNFTGLRTFDYNRRFAEIDPNEGGVYGTNIIRPSDAPPPHGQLLEFPRNGSIYIPEDILRACAEVAYATLDGIDPEMEMQNLNRTSQRFGAVSESYSLQYINQAFLNGIPSITAWNMLLPYLQDPREITVARVS